MLKNMFFHCVILTMVSAFSFATFASPFNYYLGFPSDSSSPKEIDRVKVWVFKDEGDYHQMMEKITFAAGFEKGFGKGYGFVNKLAVQWLPKIGAAAEAASGETLAGLGEASEIAAKIHTYFEKLLKPGIGFVVKKLKEDFKEIRIGYQGDFRPGQYYLKTADDKDRNKVYVVLTLGDDTRKNLEGPAHKIDMFPLWQGYVQMPSGATSIHMNAKIVKTTVKDAPLYSAIVHQVSEEEFEKQNLKLADED